MPDRLITAREAARLLNCGLSTVYAMAGDPGCPVYRVGTGRGGLRFDPDELLAWIRQRSHERQAGAMVRTAGSLPPLRERLRNSQPASPKVSAAVGAAVGDFAKPAVAKRRGRG